VLTSAKVFWVFAALYALSIVLPAAIGGHHVYFEPEMVRRTLVACLIFLAGLAMGAVMFPLASRGTSFFTSPALPDALLAINGLTVAIALYVLVFGPSAPFFASFTLTDPDAILMARENAVKLNPDVVFVRLYSWGRDIFGPVAFILSAQALRLSRESRIRLLAAAGLVASVYLGLWSGQKATLVNYLLAAFIFGAANVRSMAITAAKVTPLLVAVIAWLFWITLPQLVGDPNAQKILITAITNRVLYAPLEVATGYIDAVDRLRTVAPADALPYLEFLWSPGMTTIENHVGIQYFTANQESSIHANGAAFAYAYVIGGYIGCFLGGFLVMAGLSLATRIVAATGSGFLFTAFAASLSYMLLDIQNGNPVSYVVKITVLAVMVWAAHAVVPWRAPARLGPVTSSA